MIFEDKDFSKNSEKEDKLDELQENLYSRGSFIAPNPENESHFSQHHSDLKEDWEHREFPRQPKPFFHSPARWLSIFKKIFIVSIIFFTLSLGVALYMFFAGSNTISSNNVDISINGPVSVGGGETFSLEIAVRNSNNTALQAPDLLVEYPAGAKSSADLSKELRRYREPLGDLKPGESATRKIDAVLFGVEGETKEITVSVEYRVQGSNAIFSKETKYHLTLSSSPVTMTIDSAKEANSNQDVELSVEVVSNSNSLIKNAMLAVDYPFGFDFSSSKPEPSFGNDGWYLGDLKAGMKRTIKIKGVVSGQDGEDRVFKFSVGTQSAGNEHALGTSFLSATETITIKHPFVNLALALNGDASDIYVTKSGKVIRTDVSWSNDSGTKVTDARVEAVISGNIYDRLSVSPGSNGFFRGSDNTVVWDQTLSPQLAVLDPNDRGQVGLSFSLFNFSPESGLIKNPQMSIKVNFKGKRLNEENVPENILSTVTKTIKIASDLHLSNRVLYFSGPFTNSGPLPPRADKETTYTVVWSLTNSVNDLSDVKVTATLPSYVKWQNAWSPQGEKISYNPIGGQVEWDAGNVAAGAGFAGSPREVYFQISFTPGLNQIGSTPQLTSETSAGGNDSFAATAIESNTRQALTIDLNTDVGSRPEYARVAK